MNATTIMSTTEHDHLTMFWIGQDSEHNLFFSIGFTDPTLKAEAERLRGEYEEARAKGDYQKAVTDILPRSQSFKMKALQATLAGFTGWIFPLFIEHTFRELDMFQQQISSDRPSDRDLLCFWNQVGSEHLQFAQQLLDPSENALQHVAVNGATNAQKIANKCHRETMATLIDLSQKSGHEIDKLVTNLAQAVEAKPPAVRSIIHPALIDHVQREGQEFLRQLQPMTEPPPPPAPMPHLPAPSPPQVPVHSLMGPSIGWQAPWRAMGSRWGWGPHSRGPSTPWARRRWR